MKLRNALAFMGMLLGGTVHANVQMSQPSFSVLENQSQAVVTVVRTTASGADLAVSYRTSDGSAISGTDYVNTSGTLEWSADDLEAKKITVPIKDNEYDEVGTRSFTVELFNPIGGAIENPGQTAITILDDDDTTDTSVDSFALNTSYDSNTEGQSIVLTVFRQGGGVGESQVVYRTVNDTAIGGVDFIPVEGTLTFGDGVMTPQTVTVNLLDNTDNEDDRVFRFELTDVTNGELGVPAAATLKVLDNDAPAPDPVTVTEIRFFETAYSVNERDGQASILINRSGDTSAESSVQVVAVEGTATTPEDYQFAPQTVTWEADDASLKTINVTLINDGQGEGDESFTVQLVNPVGATLNPTPATATVTVIDDDNLSPGQIQISNQAISVLESAGSVDVGLQRVGGSDGAATAQLTLISQTARPGVDYLDTGCSVSWNDGETGARTCTILITDNADQDGDRTFNARVSAASGATVDSNKSLARIVILDDEVSTPGIISMENAAVSVTPDNGYVRLFLRRTGGLDGNQQVEYRTASLTAVENEDYFFKSGSVLFPDGDPSTRSIEILVNPNAVGQKTFEVNLLSVQGGAVLGGSTTTVTINGGDDTPRGVLSFESPSTFVNETDGTLTLRVARSGGGRGESRVRVSTEDGTAEAGVDFDFLSQTLVFADGEVTDAANPAREVTISLINNTSYRENPSFQVTLEVIGGEDQLGRYPSNTVRIRDDEVPASAIANVGFVGEQMGVSESDTGVNIQVSRSGALNDRVAVFVMTEDLTARAGVDYASTNAEVIWEAGDESTKTVTVPLLGNVRSDQDRAFRVRLAPVAGPVVVGTDALDVTIMDVPEPGRVGTVQFLEAALTLLEGNSAEIGLARVGGTEGKVEVTITPGTNFASGGPILDRISPAVVTWEDGDDAVKYVTLTAASNSNVSGNLSTILYLTSLTEGMETEARLSLVVLDDDVAETNAFGFITDEIVVSEIAGVIQIPVSRLEGLTYGTVDFVVQSGTAQNGLHFSAEPGTLVWPDGDVSIKNIVVRINNLPEVSGNAQFSVRLTNPSQGAVLYDGEDAAGHPIVAESVSLPVRIQNVEVVPIRYGALRFSQANFDVRAERSAMACMERYDGDTGPVSVFVTSLDGTAVAGEHYTEVDTILTWGDGESGERCFSVTAMNDEFVNDRQFQLVAALTNVLPFESASLGSPSVATVTIRYGQGAGALGWGFLLLGGMLALRGRRRR